MSEAAEPSQRFGEGPLARAAAFIYTLLVIEFLLLVTSAPGLVLLTLLDRDASNIPLAVACALPFGPAISAALYALRDRRWDLTDLKPASAFWRGYKLNVRCALQIWVPWLVWLLIVGVVLANFAAAGVPSWWAALLIALTLATTLWAINALVITSLFVFRVRDIVRLGIYFLGRTRGVTLRNACLLIVAFGIVVFTSEAVFALLGSVFALAIIGSSRPMIDEVRERFTS